MNIPTKDALRVTPKLGTAQRSVVAPKLVEGQIDADFLKATPIAAITPTDKQVLAMNSVSGFYEPMSLASLSGSATSTETIYSTIAQELRLGPSYIVFGPGTSQLTSGDIVMGPSGLQRMEVLTIPRVGATSAYAAATALAAAITTTTQTAVTVDTTQVQTGQYIFVDSEAMQVLSGGGTVNLVVGRGRLQTSAATHLSGAEVRRVSVVSVVHVTGGLRATGGVATSDLALHGSSTQELVVRATFTPTPPTAFYVGDPDGEMHLHVGEHSHATDTNYVVEIDGAGGTGTATFRWSDDGGGTWIATGVATSQNITHLQNGVYISWDYGTYQVGTRWDFTAIGTANQVELVRADTTADKLWLRNVEINATSSTYFRNFTSSLTYTAAGSSSQAGTFTLTLQNTGAGTQTGTGISVTVVPDRDAAGTTNVIGQTITVNEGINLTAPLASVIGLKVSGNVPNAASTIGLQINDIGGVGTITALEINSQSGAVYNIRQRGLSGSNILASPTRIGDDGPPDAGVALHLTTVVAVNTIVKFGSSGGAGGDGILRNGLGTDIIKIPGGLNDFRALVPTLIGADASPAAGVALELRSGVLRMAASTNNYIQDSAGNRVLTFASDTTAVAVTATFPGDLRINDQLGVGGATLVATRALIRTWQSFTTGDVVMLRADLAGTQTTAVSSRIGIHVTGTLNLDGNDCYAYTGVASFPALRDGGAAGTVENYAAFEGGASFPTDAALFLNNSSCYVATSPVNLGAMPVQTQRGLWVQNQGDANATTSIGVEVDAQSGSSSSSIGISIGTCDTYGLLIINSAGTPAAGISFGATSTADANLYRSASATLKTDGALIVGGLLDISTVAAGSPRMKILATSDTPTATWGAAAGNEVSAAPAGWMEIDVGGASRYIPFWT